MKQPLPERWVGDEFALLVEAVQDYAIFLLGPTGEIRSWNRGAARIFGYPADEILGHSFFQFYEEDDLERKKPQRELETAAKEGRIEDEGWRIRGDGGRFWANTVITPLRANSGGLLGFAKITRDITERRETAEQLRQSEESFRLLVQSVEDYAIFMLDPNGFVTTWNAGAHRLKGYDESEIVGRHFSAFYPEADVAAGKPGEKLRVARERGSVEDEGWRIRKDGTRFWANVVITAIHDARGELRGFGKVTRDITDRLRAEETQRSLLEQREARLQAEDERRRVEASYSAAQETSRAKDEFLMTLSHELRTPMTAVLGWARLLPTLPRNDPMFAEAVASIGRSAELQAKLIDDVLDVSRILSGKLRLSLESVDVERILSGAVAAVRAMAAGRSVTITTSFAPDLGMLVADATRLQQIAWNLLTNAVKFTPRDGSVQLSAWRAGSHVQIAVSDTGEGIEPAFLAHVFEPFRQAEGPRTRVHGGLGLGLSIVRYLVEAHGGSITAESEGKGRGATFTVTLPVAALQPEAIRAEREEAAQQSRPIDPNRLRNLSILIVDDDRETRSLISAVLRRAGASVTVSPSAAAAFEQFDRRPPDLVLSDIAMPGTDGYELARELRGREGGAKVKIVALSAFAAGAEAAGQSGFDDYLRKPIDPAALVERLASLFGR
ncbi:MAG TPA: PAS domain S-box protein [Thermoanaerobaculia bacterium]|nr:PAS domain S-box protein [Thermoanaerobaculia bacterium]